MALFKAIAWGFGLVIGYLLAWATIVAGIIIVAAFLGAF